MSEETPNKSEERLQRHAKERRAQGGDFALHPATRRMLQGEVARTLGKSAATKSPGWFLWMNSWNGRLAIGAAAVVVITGSWIFWNSRLDQRALQLARADMPVRTSALAGNGGSKGVGTAEKEFALAAEPAVRAEMEKKAAPASETVALLAATPAAQRNDNDLGKTAVDKITAVDVLAKNSVALTFQEQSTSYFANETTLSLAPVAQNNYSFNTPTDAQKPDLRNQQMLNYANAGGQNFAPPGDAAANLADRYRNQSGQASGGALSTRSATAGYANNDQKQLVETDEASKTQLSSQLARQNDALNAAESRARFSRSVAPAGAAPAAVSAPGGEALRGAVVASGAAAPENANRYYRLDDGVNDQSRSKALAPTGRAPAESSPVLNEFVIEQRGTTVRVLDADGSVYDGTVETPPSAGFVPAQDSPDGLVREVIPGDKTETAPRHQELSFRATGSNVTLRQSVVVNGRFTPGTEAVRAGRARPAEAQSKALDLATRRSATPTSNAFAGQYGAATNAASTIEGTVRIGTTNQQWFRATRRGP